MIVEVELPFFLNPMKKFGVRELSRITHSDTKTVMKYLKKLRQKHLIVKHSEEGTYAKYEADRESLLYRHEKSEYLVKKVLESGLIEDLETRCHPTAIVLFGSVQKGTYHQNSDIDIFVLAKEKKLDLHLFEKKIGYPIQLLFEENLRVLSKGLLGNIYNGLVLAGKLEVL